MLRQRLHRVPRGAWQVLWALTVAAVLVLALMPLKANPSGIVHADKAAHAMAFAAMTVMAVGGWPGRMAAVAMGMLGLGMGIEVLQGAFTVARQASLLDVLADAVGIALGLRLGGWAQANQANTAGRSDANVGG